jgi:diacylglycerol kinase (ATP)
MKKKAAFLFNPISGPYRLIPVKPMIERFVNRDLYDFTIIDTEYQYHARKLAAECASKNYDVVFAVGGDGTVNEVGNGLIGSNTALGIIPCGSGNGLARHLGISMDPFKAIKWLNKSKVVNIDYGKIAGHPFFCTCGVGFDATVSESFAKAGSRGVVTYLENVLKEMITYKIEEYHLSSNYGFDETVDAFIVNCANADQWGNNAYIAPNASVQDGELDITVIHPFAAVDIPLMALQLFNKQLDKSRNVTVHKFKKLTITRKSEGAAHFDGEPIMLGTKIDIEVVPLGIKVLIPDKNRYL